jgi:hypothetical protein
MEAASPDEAKRAATGGREAKPNAARKVMFKEEKGVEAVKRRCQRKNLKDRNAAAAAIQYVEDTRKI